MRRPVESETDDLGFSHSSETDDNAVPGPAAARAAVARPAAAAAAAPQRGGATGAGAAPDVSAPVGVGARRGVAVVGEASQQGGGGEEQADLHEYGQSLGADPEDLELTWLVREAFEAPLPTSWTEHVDAEGRLYFFNQVSEESTWSHPMDAVYRELIGLIHRVRTLTTLDQRAQSVREHLVEVHGRALANLDGWSGPYNSDTGQYYYNERLGQSTWASPIDGWEHELAVRHSVLHRSLLAGFSWPEEPPTEAGVGRRQPADLLTTPMLQLPLGLARREDDEKSSARSFYTARDSARSGASTVRSGRTGPAGAAVIEEHPKHPHRSGAGGGHATTAPAPAVVAAAAAGGQARPKPGTGDEAAGDGELEVTFGSSSPLNMPVVGRGA